MTDDNHWTIEDMPDQSGRIAIVTGANSGIGYETARALAHKGGEVIMACRNLDKANAAAETVQGENPAGSVVVMELDLGDLDSVDAFVAGFKARYDRLDLLINNAGVMHPPYGQTEQGFETQFGVNHLGHFALTGQLLDLIMPTEGARIITVSSMAHRFGEVNFDDLNAKENYRANAAYGQSKLANLLFTYELQRKLEAAGSDAIAVASHPGWTATNLQQNSGFIRFLNRFFAQTPEMGALPTLYAATAPEIQGGDYCGPSRFVETVGPPKKVKSNGSSHDAAVAARLWTVSEEMTGVQILV
ncbi:MAG: SDR family NAD(P)-dependent oxidoreductase [Chloroflexota bacterium]|nr:MAG: SDR family NAD(P)-dependent oxidoreductase [Chloroflexota bacterium]